jgi:hypothetical protein
VPKAHDEFKSVSKFKILNLGISLAAVKRLQEQNAIDMEIIVNPKVSQGCSPLGCLVLYDHSTLHTDPTAHSPWPVCSFTPFSLVTLSSS